MRKEKLYISKAMYKVLGVSILLSLIGGWAYWIWQQQDLRHNMQVQRQFNSMHSSVLHNDDQATLNLMQLAHQDQRLTKKEWQQIQQSHHEFLKSFDHSKAIAREREFKERKMAQLQ